MQKEWWCTGCKGVRCTVEQARPALCPLRSQSTFRLPLAWGLCVPPQLLQGSETEEARETEAIRGAEEMAEGAWRCTGLGHCRPLGSWAKAQDLFLQVQTYAFETAKDHASQSCPCSQARLGAELEGRYGQETLAPTVRWDDKCHFFPECSLPGLDLDVPQAGLGPHPVHSPQLWERKDGDIRLAPRGRWESEGVPIAKWELKLGQLSSKDPLPPAQGPMDSGEAGPESLKGGRLDGRVQGRRALWRGGHSRYSVGQPQGLRGVGAV